MTEQISRALDSSTVATSCSWCTRNVDPDDVKSTMMSAIPKCGAISVAPDTGTMVTAFPTRSKYRRASCGNTVATLGEPVRSSIVAIPLSSRAATTRRHPPNSRSSNIPSSRSDSHTRSHPVTPTSAAPSATNSGMSLARTRIASNSPPSEATSARSPRARTSRPASPKSSRTSSASLPLFGRATLSISSFLTQAFRFHFD